MAYSSEEIQAAVEQIVRSHVRKPVDVSGVRNVQVQFDDIREIAAGVFITYPNTPYYFIMLGLNRLNEQSRNLTQDLAEFTALIDATGRRTFPINDLTTLADADNALLELEGALGGRSGNFKDPSTLPAYQRWSSSSLKYLKHVGASIKFGGELVDTPNAAKAQIPSSFTAVMDSYNALLEQQASIQQGPADYVAMQLPSVVAQGVVSKARAVLEADREELEGLSESARLEVARDKTLNILTARAVVDAYVNGQKITEALSFIGQVEPYSDEDHEATSAVVEGDLAGPWGIVRYPVVYTDPLDSRSNNQLVFTIEAGEQVEIFLPESFIAFLNGTGKTQPPNDAAGVYTFYGTGGDVGINGAPPEAGTPPRYCENFSNTPGEEIQWFFPDPNDVLIIDQLIEGGPTTRYTVNLINKGASEGREDFTYPIQIPPPIPAQDNSWYAFKLQLTQQQVVDRINAVLTGPGCYIEAYVAANFTIGIRCKDPIDSVVDRQVGISIPSVVVGAETNTAAQMPLGFAYDLSFTSRRTQASTIVNYVNAYTSKVVAHLVATPTIPEFDHLLGWTNVADRASIVLAKFSGYGVCATTGTTATFTTSVYGSSFTELGVTVGDIICLPRQYVMNLSVFEPIADEGAQYVVTSVSDHVLQADHVSGPLALDYHSRAFDVGLPSVLTQVSKYDVVQIWSVPNDGAYEITAIDSYSPFRVRFDVTISKSQEGKDPLPMAVEMTVGSASVGFTSASTDVASYIKVEGSFRPLAFTSVEEARGYTPYVQVPDGGPKLKVTDRFDFYETAGVRYSRQAKNVEGTIVTLNDEVPSDVTFTIGTVAPGVQIVWGAKKSAESTTLELEAWTKVAPTDPATFELNMNAMLNPLLVGSVPALSKVSEAKAALAPLQSKVAALATISEVQLTGPEPDATPTGFYVEPIPAADDLLATLKDRGCDRAIDLLLSGKFSEFFGLDMDEMSYLGTMMKTAREVARSDLSVSRFGTRRARRKILSITYDTDPDWDHSDSDAQAASPDPIAGWDLPSAPDPV